MLLSSSSRASRVARRLRGLAAPVLLVGLIVVTQALGRTSSGAQTYTGPGAPNVRGLERTINRLIANETADLRLEQRLINKQQQANLKLFSLEMKRENATNPHQIHAIDQSISKNLAAFNRLQTQLNFNQGALVYDLAVTNPFVARELAVLGQISSSMRVTQFILIAETRQQAIVAALQSYLSRPPATPFQPF